MNSVSGYLLLSVSLGILAGVASQTVHPSFRESVDGVTGVILLLALTAPIFGLISSPPSLDLPLPDSGELREGEYVEVVTEAMERGIAEELAARFSLDASSLDVICGEIDITEMRATSVTVSLTCSPENANFPEIRHHVLENYVTEGGRCEVKWSYE